MIWVWNFILYSFFGFLLEVAYARATGGRGDRKSLLVLPLCPVYGVGACLILLLPRTVIQNPFTLFLLGGLAATAAEYGMAILYERGLGVSFWDYTGLPGSIQGKICLPFSLAWGALALPLIYFVHPAVARLTAGSDLDGGRHGGSGHGGVWGADEGDWEPGLSAVVSKAGGKGPGGWLTAP